MNTSLVIKRSLVLALVLVLFLIFPGQAAEASQKPEEKTVKLQSVSYHTSSMVVAFIVTGFTSETDIRGAVYVDKKFNVLHCELAQSHEVKCYAEAMKKYRGRNARIWFAGLPFYVKMPGDLPDSK
jgi:hypothetical protein